jgi:hypothetical protein
MSYGFKFLLHIFITPKSQLYYKNDVLLDLKLTWIVHQRNWIPMCSTLLNWGNFVMFISIASIMGIIAPMPPPTACPPPPFLQFCWDCTKDGYELGFQAQTRAQRQDDFMITLKKKSNAIQSYEHSQICC